MDNCIINLQNNPKLSGLIEEITNGNKEQMYQFSQMVSKEFMTFAKSDATAQKYEFDKIPKGTLRRLLRDFYNSKYFNVSNNSRIKGNAGLYAFKNLQVFNDGVQYAANSILWIYSKLNQADLNRSDLIPQLKARVRQTFKKALVSKLNAYGAHFDINSNIEDMTAFAYDRKNNVKEIDKNFADLLVSAQNIDFWNEAFNNSKIVNLGIKVTDEDQLAKEAEMLDEDEERFFDNEQADDVDLSTRQWDFGQVNNYTKLVSDEIKMYFNTLQKQASTQRFPNGRYDVDRSNSLGVPMYHTYQECVIELSELIRQGGWKSLQQFIDSIRALAGRKSEFAAFSKVADDMTSNPDLASAIYRDVNKYIVDVVELDIADNGSVSPRIANNNNRPTVKMYLNLRNDLKGTALTQMDRGLEIVNRIEKLLDRNYSWFKDNGERYRRGRIPADDPLLIEMQNKFGKATELLKTVMKMYFPNIDASAIDKYIKNHENTDIYGDTLGYNVNHLNNQMSKVVNGSLQAAATYSSQQYERNEVRKYNRTHADQKPMPVYMGGFFNTTLENTLGEIAASITQYSRSQAELNFRNISNNLQSALIYNSYLTNLVKILSDPETLQLWVNDVMRNPAEYAYSPIIMDRPDLGIQGLVTEENGRYVPSRMAQYLIHMYMLNGITDGSNGKSYTNMSDADYMLTAFHLFTGRLQEYRKFETGNNDRTKNIEVAEDRTRPFLLKTPSDAPKNFAVTMPIYRTDGLVSSAGRVSINMPIANILKRAVYGEIQEYVLAEQAVREANADRTGELKRRLIDNYHTGRRNAFHIMRLNNNVYNVEDAVLPLIRQYLSTGELTVDQVTGEVRMPAYMQQVVDDAVAQWIAAYWEKSVEDFNNIVGEIRRDPDEIRAYMFNQYVANLSFDDLFTGNAKYYKDAQTILKREKQTQAGGTSYGASFGVTEFNTNPLNTAIAQTGQSIMVGGREVQIRSGWNAILIKNTQRGSSNRKILYDQLIKAGVEKERARQLAEPFGYNEDETDMVSEDFYENGTKVNDAQSYITIYEAARRLKLLGQYNRYKTLLDQLTDDTTRLEDINPSELSSFLQVFKNFYYDHYFDPQLNRHVSRQIKNAEFVLVPKFLGDSSLGRLARMMIENDIDQVNTQETSKAVNYDVLEYWDKNGVAPEDITQFTRDAIATKKPFNYLYLYKQQDVPQHMVDVQNKAGIQLMKKAIDNLTEGLVSKRTSTAKDNFIRAYVANIQASFNELMDKFGIKFDKNETIMPTGERIDFSKIWRMARAEVARLGRDSNMLDYFTVKNDNTGETVMPSFFNVQSTKVESIAQSLFNNNVTRQKLRGWHAAQVSSVGFDHIIPQVGNTEASERLGQRIELQYHKENNVVEILLPKWASGMFNKYDAEGNLVQEINIEDLDEDVKMCLGSRIPTEGPQSAAVMKVVGFLPEWMGSTVVVPDEWVTQTGSKFKADSIYGIAYETYIDSEGKVHKVQYIDGNDEQSQWLRYANYVNRNVNKIIRQENALYLTDEEKRTYRQRATDLVNLTNQEESAKFRKLIENTLAGEKSAYEMLTDEAKERIDPIFQDRSIKFKDRVTRVISELNDLEMEGKANDGTQAMLEIYNKAAEIINMQIDFNRAAAENVRELMRGVYQDYFRDAVRARAEAGGLMSFDDFIKQSVEMQNSRQARNNRILDSLIEIMNSPDLVEGTMSRSNFEDIVDGIRKTDALMDASEQTQACVYDPATQVRFRRNAMSGATLKAFSVSRDTAASVFNVTRARLATPFHVRYGSNVNMETARKAFDVSSDGVVTHDRIGNSKNDRNVMGEFVTVATSHTTAHILDAIKSGAIPNENEYTFAAFKTLFDIGMDAYSAILWLRQPGVSRIVDAYYGFQSVFAEGEFNPVHAAIKSLAEEIGLYVNNKKVNKFTPIQQVVDQLQRMYGKRFEELIGQGARISMNYVGNNISLIDVPRMERRRLTQASNLDEQLMDLAAILNFDYVNERTKTIQAYARVMNPDKFGAKQTLFATRKVFKDMAKLIATKKDLEITDERGTSLLHSLYPGLEVGENGNINLNAFVAEDRTSESSYPSVYNFLRCATAPSVLINSGLFTTESKDFVDAVDGINMYLPKDLDEKSHDRLKKYIVSQQIMEANDILSDSVYIDSDGEFSSHRWEIVDDSIHHRRTDEEISDDIATDILRERARLYGYTPYVGDFNVEDVNNPTDNEMNIFLQMTPAQKVHFIQSRLTSKERSVFDYLKVNMYNENIANRQGVSEQRITYDEQENDKEWLYRSFEQAFFSNNWFIRATAFDLVKYAFVVEGYNFRLRNISKLIKNSVLYTDYQNGGTQIVDNSRTAIEDVDRQRMIEDNTYEDFIRSHSNLSQIPFYKIKAQGDNITVVPNTERMYHFDLNNAEDQKKAIKCKIFKTVKKSDGRVYGKIVSRYVNLQTPKGRKTLYKVNYIEGSHQVYLTPLNLLMENEYGEFSANPSYNTFPSRYYYRNVIDQMEQGLDPLKDKNELLTKEGIAGYRAPEIVSNEQRVQVPTDPNFIESHVNDESPIKAFAERVDQAFNPTDGSQPVQQAWIYATSDIMRNAFKTSKAFSRQIINGNEYMVKRVFFDNVQDIDLSKNKSKAYEGIRMAQRNGIKLTRDIYFVRPYFTNLNLASVPDLNDVHESSISSEVDDTTGFEFSQLGRLAQEMYLDVRDRYRIKDD